MARVHRWSYLKNEEGVSISNANLKLYLTGTQNEAKIYSNSVTSVQLDQSTWTTNVSGFFDYYIGNEWDANGYDANQCFDLSWSVSGGTRIGTIENMQIFPYLFGIDEFDSNTDKNKLLSNELAYQFDSHVDSNCQIEPHGIESVDTDDSHNSTFDKVVTNELMYRIDDLLDTLLTCGGDAISVTSSGSLIETIGLDTFTPSGSGFYTDLNYNIQRSRMYPIVQFYASAGKVMVNPREVKNINTNTIRVWTNTNDNLMATILGSGSGA